MEKKKKRTKMIYISANEVADWAYCNKMWYFKRKEEKEMIKKRLDEKILQPDNRNLPF